MGVDLRTATGNTFKLKLGNMEEESSDSEETLQVVSSITATHRISMESYHELSMKLPQLPRSYKVRS